MTKPAAGIESRYRVDDLKERVPLHELVGQDVTLKRTGSRWMGCCPFHGERTPSFSVRALDYKCFACGASGDHFDWLRYQYGYGFVEAAKHLAALSGGELIDRRPTDKLQRDRQQRQQEMASREERDRRYRLGRAREVWGASVPAQGTPVEMYLQGRGIDLAALGYPPTIRFNPACWHDHLNENHPAMVAYVQGGDGAFTGVHRTYLLPDGSDKLKALMPDGKPAKAKLMLGACWRGAVRFAKAGTVLAVGEGIETCLSVRQHNPELAVWAALSLGNIAGEGEGKGEWHPFVEDRRLPSVIPNKASPGVLLPETVRRVLILGDHDNKDQLMAEAILQRAVNRWRSEGRDVSLALPPEGMDFNDWWRLQAAGGGIHAG